MSLNFNNPMSLHDYMQVVYTFGRNTMKVLLCPSQSITAGGTLQLVPYW